MSASKPVLFLLHPAGSLAAVWRPLRRMWESDATIFAPDLRPEGDPASQLQRWAAAAAAQIRAHSDAPAHLVGASLGASVALRIAGDHAELVAGMVLDSAQLGGPPPPAPLRLIGRGFARIARLLPPHLVAAALLSQFPAYQGDDRAAVRADMLRLGIAGIAGHLRAQLSHDIRADAGRINTPTLLLAGSRDPLVRSGAVQALHAALPNAQLIAVAGAGHVTFLSRPQVIAQVVTRQVARSLQ